MRGPEKKRLGPSEFQVQLHEMVRFHRPLVVRHLRALARACVLLGLSPLASLIVHSDVFAHTRACTCAPAPFAVRSRAGRKLHH